jgi:hypothetical protein
MAVKPGLTGTTMLTLEGLNLNISARRHLFVLSPIHACLMREQDPARRRSVSRLADTAGCELRCLVIRCKLSRNLVVRQAAIVHEAVSKSSDALQEFGSDWISILNGLNMNGPW